MPNSHGIDVTYVPLDGVGARIAGSIPGQDMHLENLRDIRDGLDEAMSRTDAALADPALRDLAMAVRGALLSIDQINFHLLELHRGITAGNLNYTITVQELDQE